MTLINDVFQLKQSIQFKKDLKKARKQGKKLTTLKNVVLILQQKQELPGRYRDQLLVGNWNGCRECHLESDWLLIYKIKYEEGLVYLARLGSHSELFK